MSKFAISSSGVAFGTTADVKESLDILSEAGFTAVDFWLNKFCGKDSSPMRQANWRDWLKDIKAYADSKELIVGQVHANWDHTSQVREDFTVPNPPEDLVNNFEACALLDCKKLVFHPIQRWMRMPDESMRQKVLDTNVAFYSQMLPEAEKYCVELLLENLFDHKHIQQEGDPIFPFSNPEDLVYVADKLNSPLVGFCLDTGHANINKEDIPRMIRLYGRRLRALHLNDNFGKIGPIYEDLHMFPGNGHIVWSKIFEALKEVDYCGTMNFEPHNGLEEKTHRERVVMMRFARQMLEVMLDENGLE